MCLNHSKVEYDQEYLNTSHPQYKNDSYCHWNYLGENYYPRYIVEMECHSVNSCRDNNNDITVQLLKRLDGCSEEGFEKWSNSCTTPRLMTAGCSCKCVL